MTTYTTIRDLTDREIVPALTGVEPNFDIDAFVSDLRDADLITWTGSGFELVTDEDGTTPEFWTLVEKHDAIAMAAQR